MSSRKKTFSVQRGEWAASWRDSGTDGAGKPEALPVWSLVVREEMGHMFGDTTWTVCSGLRSELIYDEVDSKEAEDASGPSTVSLLPEGRLAPEAGATYRRYSQHFLLPDSSGSTAVSPHSLSGMNEFL